MMTPIEATAAAACEAGSQGCRARTLSNSKLACGHADAGAGGNGPDTRATVAAMAFTSNREDRHTKQENGHHQAHRHGVIRRSAGPIARMPLHLLNDNGNEHTQNRGQPGTDPALAADPADGPRLDESGRNAQRRDRRDEIPLVRQLAILQQPRHQRDAYSAQAEEKALFKEANCVPHGPAPMGHGVRRDPDRVAPDSHSGSSEESRARREAAARSSRRPLRSERAAVARHRRLHLVAHLLAGALEPRLGARILGEVRPSLLGLIKLGLEGRPLCGRHLRSQASFVLLEEIVATGNAGLGTDAGGQRGEHERGAGDDCGTRHGNSPYDGGTNNPVTSVARRWMHWSRCFSMALRACHTVASTWHCWLRATAHAVVFAHLPVCEPDRRRSLVR